MKKTNALMKGKLENLTFNTLNTLIMIIIIIVTLYPFWFCIIGSLNEGQDYMRGGVNLFVRKFTLDNYSVVLGQPEILNAYKVTVLRTIIGTLSSLFITAMFAYGFSRKNLWGRGFYAALGIITLYFGGGLIPYYLLLKNLHLLNNFLVYILPGLLSFWNVLIFQTHFKSIPASINESAYIDGAGEYTIFLRLILPLSKPILAAIALFTGVAHWNSFYDSMIFTSSDNLQTIQVFLMKIIRNTEYVDAVSQFANSVMNRTTKVNSTTIQLATMMATTLPIIVLYPFLQRYFVKGVMIGSIKG